MTGGAAGTGHIPQSLLDSGLQPVWARVRRHLDKHGAQRRGAVALSDLNPASELTLRSMLGSVSRRLDLSRLEAALVERGLGADLSEALTQLGHPPSAAAAQRRSDRARASAAQTVLRDAAESWPEPWAREWADAAIKAGLHGGLDPGEVEALVEDVRRLIDYLDSGDSIVGGAGLSPQRGQEPSESADADKPPGSAGSPLSSRTELAAALFGSAHALDPGTKLTALLTRALQLRTGRDLTGRELWEAAGIQADRVSSPALVWGVPATGSSMLAEMLRGAASGGLPLHLSLMALRRDPVTVPAGTQVLVAENPRLVEAAAERSLNCCVAATNGNPTTAVTTLLQQLQGSGARLWYHGDFDAAGIAICRRMHDLGCRPWLMGARHYLAAIRRAENGGTRLERDAKGCGPTPWDTTLQEVFDTQPLIVHEEFVLDEVLSEFQHMALRAAATDR